MSDRRMFGPRYALRTAPLKAFANEGNAFAAGAFFMAISGNDLAARWCEANGIEIVRAAGELQGPTGGYAVPRELMREIIALRETYGSFRQAAHVVPMSSDIADVPQRTGGLTAYFPGENSEITESTATWGNVSLNARKLAALTRSSVELNEDAVIDIGEYFATEMAYAFAQKEDECGWNGTGAAAYSGMRGVTHLLLDGSHDAGKVAAASGHNSFAELDMADLVSLIAKLPAYAVPGAKWFISSVGFALTICRLAGNAGGILMQKRDGKVVPTFLGWPVVLAQALPQVTTDISGQVMLAFGDLSLAATLGERRGVDVRMSEQRYLELDQLAWRGTERVDIVVHSLGDNSTAGPLVGLVGE